MNAERLLALYERIADAPDALPRLRSFVLDLAVRGKLVPQDPNDEPASRLLQRIGAEKAQLGIKTIHSPVSSDEAPFELPAGWSWTCIGEICSKTGSGSTPRGGKEVYEENGIPFLRSQNVYDDGLRLDDVAYIDRATHERMAATCVFPGDLLLNITGGSMGRCCRVPDSFSEANVSQHVAIIRVVIKGMEAFLHFLVLSPYFQAFIFDKQTGAGRGGLPKNRMDLIAVALPPLAEQLRIVTKVDELMALCEQSEAARAGRELTRDQFTAATLARLNAPDPETFRDDAHFALEALPALTVRADQIKHLRQSILNLAVRGKLVPQDTSECAPELPDQAERHNAKGRLDFDIPANWSWARVSEVATARLGKMLDKAKNRGKQYPYLRNTNIHWFEVRTDDTKQIQLNADEVEEYLLKSGDVLICEGGHGIGRSAVWRGQSAPMVFQKALHRVRPDVHLSPDFFAYCCFVYFHEGVMQTYFTGVGIPHFTGKALARLVFPLPPAAEQQRIVARVDELMALCDRLEASLAVADDTRRRLLEALLAEALAPGEERELEAAE